MRRSPCRSAIDEDRIVRDERVVDPVRGGHGPSAEGDLRVGVHPLRRPAARRARRPRGAAGRGSVPLRQPPLGMGRHRGRQDRRRRLLGRRPHGRDHRTPRQHPHNLRAGAAPGHPPRARAVRGLGALRADDGWADRPPGAAPGEAPAVHPVQGAHGVDHAGPHDPRRRHVGLRGARREQVPAALDLRRRRTARREGRARRLQGVVPRRVRPAHAVG